MLIRRYIYLVVGCACLAAQSTALALSVGQVDTFEDGTTQGWQINVLGSRAPGGAPPAAALPQNMSSGGPQGADDNWLQLTSLGTPGAGGRLSVVNLAQWAGDYIGSGVQAIRMDVNNLGTSDLYLRLLVADPIPGPPQNLAFSTEAVHVPGGSGWVSVLFPIGLADLTAGLGSIETALSNTTELRLFHSEGAEFPGAPITAVLGVDNIEAVGAAVPDVASTGMLLGCALLSAASFRRLTVRIR